MKNIQVEISKQVDLTVTLLPSEMVLEKKRLTVLSARMINHYPVARLVGGGEDVDFPVSRIGTVDGKRVIAIPMRLRVKKELGSMIGLSFSKVDS